MTTDAQDRVANALAAKPNVVRGAVIPRPNATIEVWLYDGDDVLLEVATVYPSGHFASRPGVRVTTDTYIGPPEGRPEPPDDTLRADWSTTR